MHLLCLYPNPSSGKKILEGQTFLIYHFPHLQPCPLPLPNFFFSLFASLKKKKNEEEGIFNSPTCQAKTIF